LTENGIGESGLSWTSFLDVQMITRAVASQFYWVFLALLFVNVMQRSYRGAARKKRIATVYLSAAVFLLYVAAHLILMRGGGDMYFVPVAAAVIAALYRYRDHTFPFSLRCRQSGRRLDWNTILFRDSNVLPAAGADGRPSPLAVKGSDAPSSEQDSLSD